MKFHKKIKIGDIPRIPSREKFCKENCIEDPDDRCYRCLLPEENEIDYWIDQISDRYLYILSKDKFPSRRVCVWCDEGSYNIKHFNEAHNKTMKDAKFREVQLDLYKELKAVRRTGRWWALNLYPGACQKCDNPSPKSCNLDRKRRGKSKLRFEGFCIFALKLDIRNLIDMDEYFRYGFIMV